ncbi:hypothetical protein CBS101457_002529 [Exobasidium rhododendri]|nr:hypothetical protein CBS101457_002529 [Exobasidium rhododendri]
MTAEVQSDGKRPAEEADRDETTEGGNAFKRAKMEESKVNEAVAEDIVQKVAKGDVKKPRHTYKTGRDRGERRNDNRGTGEAGAKGEEAADDKTPRLPKRKVSVAFGYCGTGYSGLQINDGVKTIEGDIFAAFCKLGAISEDNAVNPNKVGLQRAARTDRGVHAAGNLLVIKLILEPPAAEPVGLVAKMNEILPEFIRIWGLTKVENSFNARSSCDSRQYEYLLPTYVFLPPKPGSQMYMMMQKWKDEMKEEEEGETGAHGDEYRPTLHYLLNHPFWRAQKPNSSFADDTTAKKNWRISAKQLDRVREMFAKYEGTHNFHNFTLGKLFRERSAHRHMINLNISDPFIINETEWISFKFHGQSFMLHQIRKMIGLLILIGRSTTPASLIPETYGPARIHVPKAPGLGLLLEEPIFAGYNRHLEGVIKKQPEVAKAGPGDGGIAKEAIQFSKFSQKKDAFKNHWIYDRIYKEEEETHEYVKFVQYLDILSSEDFEYLHPKGVIPTCAIIKVGEQVREVVRRKAVGKNGAKVEEDDDDIEGESDDEEALLKGKAEEMEG